MSRQPIPVPSVDVSAIRPAPQTIDLHSMINLRIGLDSFNNKSQEILDAITHLDKLIHTIVSAIQLNTKQDIH